MFFSFRYSEVLRMLSGRNPSSGAGRISNEAQFNGRRRHGSLSSLPSSSVSGRPIRDRRRVEGRRKVRDIKVSFVVSSHTDIFMYELCKF